MQVLVNDVLDEAEHKELFWAFDQVVAFVALHRVSQADFDQAWVFDSSDAAVAPMFPGCNGLYQMIHKKLTDQLDTATYDLVGGST